MSMLFSLRDDDLVEVLRAAQRSRLLSEWASLCRQLCSLARSRIRRQLCVRNQQQADLVNRSRNLGLPPFSGCTSLTIAAYDLSSRIKAGAVLWSAQQWTALRYLQLDLSPPPYYTPQSTAGNGTSRVLSAVAGLQQLRELRVSAPTLDASSAVHIQQYTQLTSLSLHTRRAADDGGNGSWDLSGLSRLVELNMHGSLGVQAAAGALGPIHLPSSLRLFCINISCQDGPPLPAVQQNNPSAQAGWVARLASCPQLQELYVSWSPQQQGGEYASSVVHLLAQHSQQLRSLSLGPLSEAVEDADQEWRPDGSLVALTGLQRLCSGQLCIREEQDWQHLAQIPALRELVWVHFYWAPLSARAGPFLSVVHTCNCSAHLGGYELGQLMLACPLLESAEFRVSLPAAGAAGAGLRLEAHPRLSGFRLTGCGDWGDAAAEGGGAVAQFAALAPVLAGLKSLQIEDWPQGRIDHLEALPDLSGCTALWGLHIGGRAATPLWLEQEEFLHMVAPLVRLQFLTIRAAARVDARIALVLQHMLPQLRHLSLFKAASLVPAPDGDTLDWRADEQAALHKVTRLLRPRLHVYLCDR